MRVLKKVAEEVQLILMIVGNGIRRHGAGIFVLMDNEVVHSYEVRGKNGEIVIFRVLFSPENLDFQVEPSPRADIDSSNLQKTVEDLISGAFSRSSLFKTHV